MQGGPHKIAWAIANPTKPDEKKADKTDEKKPDEAKDEHKDGKAKEAKGRRALVASEAAFDGSKSTASTLAPSRTNTRAMALPRPIAVPVMIAILPASRPAAGWAAGWVVIMAIVLF